MNKQSRYIESEGVNITYLLLLVKENDLTAMRYFPINDLFTTEKKMIDSFCEQPDFNNDNIESIVDYIRSEIRPKVQNTFINYCAILDKPYQGFKLDVDLFLTKIIQWRDWIYSQANKIENNLLVESYEGENVFDFQLELQSLKLTVADTVKHWCHAFEVADAYLRARQLPNLLLHSHRLSGWSNPEYKISENLKIEIKTNFGYGNSSYFFSLLTYKDIPISSLSEWVNYRYCKFSEVIRFTKSYVKKIRTAHENPQYTVYIDNENWVNAIDFVSRAANLLITDEDSFIEKHIIGECESMVKGLDDFLTNPEVYLYLEKENNEDVKERIDISAVDSITFRGEKIVGALEFIEKINEYNQITPTLKYIDRIKEINKEFAPKIPPAILSEKDQYVKFKNKYNEGEQMRRLYRDIEKDFLNDLKQLGQEEFNELNGGEYLKFTKHWKKFKEQDEKLITKMNLHSQNYNKLENYLSKLKAVQLF